jgi:homoserine kinase
MKIVRTYATSANLGPGFDAFGICLNLYNEYAFEVSNKYEINEFNEKYKKPENNLKNQVVRQVKSLV